MVADSLLPRIPQPAPHPAIPGPPGQASSRRWRRLLRGLLLAPLLLAACAPGPDPATMRHAAEPAPGGFALAAVAQPGQRPVEIIVADAELVAARRARGLSTDPRSWTYRAGVGDVLQLHVADEPELTQSGGYTVETDGTIAIPYLGPVPVEGRSRDEIRSDLMVRLSAHVARPQVDVRVTGFHARHVTIVGAVRQPNRQVLTTVPLTVIDAINAAGGLGEDADPQAVTITRDGVPRPVDMAAFLDTGQALPVLQDGDILHVARRGWGRATRAEIRLLAPGRSPRSVTIDRNGTVLADVLGAAPAAPDDAVYVLRARDGGVRAYRFTGANARHPDIGGRFDLAPDDRVLSARGAAPRTAGDLARLQPALHDMARR